MVHPARRRTAGRIRRSRRSGRARNTRCARRLRCPRPGRPALEPVGPQRGDELRRHIPTRRRTRRGRRRGTRSRARRPRTARRRRRGRAATPTRRRRRLARGGIGDVPGVRRERPLRRTRPHRRLRRPRRTRHAPGPLRIPIRRRTRHRRRRTALRHTRRRRTRHTRTTRRTRIAVSRPTRRTTRRRRAPLGRTRHPGRPSHTRHSRRTRHPTHRRTPTSTRRVRIAERRCERRRRQLAPARDERRLGVRRRRGRRSVVVGTAQRRREHGRGQRHGTVVPRIRVGVRPGPRRGPGRHPRRGRRPRGHPGLRLRKSPRPGPGPSPAPGTRRSTRTRAHTGTSTGTSTSTSTDPGTGPAPPIRNPQLIRRLLQPLRRRQQEGRLIQIDPSRRRRRGSGRVVGGTPVLLLVPADHLTHRQRGPQRGLTAVPGDHQPLRTPVRARPVRTVLRPHDEAELELPHPHLTMLVRGHIPVDPLFGALLRLRERHHRSVHSPAPETGTDRANPPSTIRFATVSNSGGLPASRDRKASKSSPHGSSSRATRSAGGTEGSTSRASS